MSDKKPKRWMSKTKSEKKEKPAAASGAPETKPDEKSGHERKRAPFYRHPSS